eukprot:5880388-Alexandrium_andersonii.AAC.1
MQDSGVDRSAWSASSGPKQPGRIFEELIKQGIAGPHPDRENAYCLTKGGLGNVAVGIHLKGPALLSKVRADIERPDYTVWELILDLQSQGFQHVIKKADKKDTPYRPGDPTTKVWYTRPNATSISKPYLLALASGTCNVDHWHTSGYYECLMAGVPYTRQPTKRIRKFANVQEDEWDIPAQKSATTRRQAPRKRKPVLAESVSSPSPSSSSDSESSAGSSSSSSTSAGEAAADLEPDGGAPAASQATQATKNDSGDERQSVVSDLDNATGLNSLVMTFKDGAH